MRLNFVVVMGVLEMRFCFVVVVGGRLFGGRWGLRKSIV